MSIKLNASEKEMNYKKLLQQEFQSILKYLSLYFSSQLKHADLSIRKIGFDFFYFFTLRIFFIFLSLLGLVFISYSTVKLLHEFLFFSEALSYLIVGMVFLFVSLFFLVIVKKIKERKNLFRKIRKLKNEFEKTNHNSTALLEMLSKNKVRNEKDLILLEEVFYKELLIHSYEKLKKNTINLFSIQHWVKNYPFESVGLSLFAGFYLSVDSFSCSSFHSRLDSNESNSENFIHNLIEEGSLLLKEIIPPLIIHHYTKQP